MDSTAGVVYVIDSSNHRIRRVTLAGIVTTLAGNGAGAFANGIGNQASFYNPYGGAVDPVSKDLFVGDGFNFRVRRVTASGVVTTFAGIGTSGSDNSKGLGLFASFTLPDGIAIDSSGVLYVGDRSGSAAVRVIAPDSSVRTLAGGSTGYRDGAGSTASFNNTFGVAVDAGGNVYVGDRNNHVIRLVTPAGAVSTFAGSARVSGWTDGVGTRAAFNNPTRLSFAPNGNLIVPDWGNNCVRMITPSGQVSTLAGGAGGGYADGVGSAALFLRPEGVAVDSYGTIYIVEQNMRLRVMQCVGTSMPPTPTPSATPSFTSTPASTPSAVLSYSSSGALAPVRICVFSRGASSSTAILSKSPPTHTTPRPFLVFIQHLFFMYQRLLLLVWWV